MRNPRFLALVLFSLALAAPVQAGEELADALSEYLAFTEFQGGNILPEQIGRSDWAEMQVIDARRDQDYAAGHIPGAEHIEWRTLVDRRDEIARDRLVVVYCNTGSLSAQGAFALKLLGYDNVKVLTGGYDGFVRKGGLDAQAQFLQAANGD